MKALVESQLADALDALRREGIVPPDVNPEIVVTRTRDPSHGDFASNLAMSLAKPCRRAPREIADHLVKAMPGSEHIDKVVIAGPGFINFFQVESRQADVVAQILDQGRQFGRSAIGTGQRVQVEFVSANPTGPLHVGHGRGAALGDSIARLLAAVGFEVCSEYYVNDAGRQMDILAVSVWLHYLECAGESVRFPSNGYKGEYVRDIGQALYEKHGKSFVRSAASVLDSLTPDEDVASGQTGDKERHVDDLIDRMRSLLGPDEYRRVFDAGLGAMLGDIRDDLAGFGVEFDCWFSERSLAEEIVPVVDRLEAAGHVYEQDGVRWFRSTSFGDDKDRPLVRRNGRATYFASDVAYINNKLERGFDRVLYVFGADHHGFTARLQAACEALGHSPERLDFLLIQFVNLYRGSERVQMSTRSGSFVTLRELRAEVGNDVARFFYVMRKYQQHLDFDLELATSQSNDNPVYYVQYAHARICSVERQREQRGFVLDRSLGLASLDRLVEDSETRLLTLLATYPEVLERAALAHEPHQLTGYLRDLAHGLHSYYNAHKILVDDAALCQARLCLLAAVRQVLVNGLDLLGVSAPEVM